MHRTRILVPIDFSAESRKALEYAGMFARQFRGSITLLHVVEPIVYEADYGYGLVTRQVPNQALLKKAETQLDNLRKKLPGGKMSVATVVRTGRSQSQIIQTAKDSESELIIMGTHSDTSPEKTAVASIAENVVRHAPCPVLVVKEKEKEFV